MTTLYRIHWKSNITGATWHGTGLFPKSKAEQYRDYMNEQDESIQLIHWIEPVEVEEAPDDGPDK